MFNFWNLYLTILSIFIIALLFIFKNPKTILILSEFNWIVVVTNTIVFASNNNDPRYFLLTFLFLFLAAIELVLYLISFFYKNNLCLN